MKNVMFFSGSNKALLQYAGRFFHCMVAQNVEDSAAMEEFVHNNKVDIVFQNALHYKSLLGPAHEYYHNMQYYLSAHHVAPLVEKALYFGSVKEFDVRLPMENISETEFGRSVPVGESDLGKYTMNLITEKSQNIYNLRLFSLLEEGNMWDRDVLNNLCCKAVFNLPLHIETDGYYDYIYIEDLNKIALWFFENKPLYHSYNVCPGRPLLLSELAQIVKRVTNCKSEIVVENKGDQKSCFGNNARLMGELQSFDFTPIETAIETVCRYYDAHKELVDYSVLVQT